MSPSSLPANPTTAAAPGQPAPRVPFLDIPAITASVAPELGEACQRVIERGWFVLGKELEAFEAEFATWCGVPHVVGVASGLDALMLSLLALDLPPGAEVIIPSHTYIATALAVNLAGLTPVMAACDESTFNLDPAACEAVVTERTAAILAVHLYGGLAPMPALRALAHKHGLALLEDVAQGHGARETGGGLAGALSDAGCFSFYPGKNLGALGDGGAVACHSSALAEKLRMLRNYGSAKKYVNELKGFNSRLDEMQAAALRVKLPRLHIDNGRRRAIAERYGAELEHPALRLPAPPPFAESHVWHLYVVRVAGGAPARGALQQHLEAAGIGTLIHYPVPIHKQQAYAGHDFGASAPGAESLERGLALAERLADEVLSLPISPVMTDAQVSHVIETCNQWRG